MILQLICQKLISGYLVFPNQGTDSLYKQDIYSINFKENLPITVSPPEINQLLLTEVDLNNNEIINIIEILDPNKILDNKLFDKIIKHNTQIIGDDRIIKNIIPIPQGVYIDNIVWDFIISSVELEEYVLLIGPKGCGKSTVGRAVAKAKGYNFYPINCGTLFKPKQTLQGGMQAKDGSTFFTESLFLKNYTSEVPTIIYLQELSRIPQAAANSLMTITEKPDSFLYIEDKGELVKKGSKVIFMADANFGIEYSGTSSLDGAFLDRFVSFTVDYLPEEEEIDLIMNRIKNISYNDVSTLVFLANKLRKQAEQLQMGVSTRKLLSMANYLSKGFTIEQIKEHVFKNIFLNGTQNNYEEVTQIFNSI